MHRSGARHTVPVALCALTWVLLTACTPASFRDTARSTAPAAPTAASSASSAAPSPSSAAMDPSSAPATPTGPQAVAEAALKGLDRRAQVLQLFVVGVPLTDLPRGAALAEQGVGGVFLAGRSQAAASDLAATTRQWQATAPGAGLWVAVDQEGGAVQTLRGPGFPRLPAAREQGRLPAGGLAGLADGLGASLTAAGINLDLAPVADVVPAGTEAANPPIGAFGRQYGATAAQVVPAARTVVDGLSRHGVTAALKHFPGLGRVHGNTDDTASVVDTVTAPGDEQVRAFATLADSPAHPFVMASTAVYSRIDGTRQAAFSDAVLTGLLRRQLGFDGVVVSDDLGNATAVAAVPPGERATRFIAAGGTLVLTVNPDLLPQMVAAVLDRDRTDTAFSAALDAAVRTALVAKARAGLLR
jgi:beta-glucosidase-like glycosyl hydrolase